VEAQDGGQQHDTAGGKRHMHRPSLLTVVDEETTTQSSSQEQDPRDNAEDGSPTKSTTTNTTATNVAVIHSLDSRTIPWIGIFGTSLILLISMGTSSREWGHPNTRYGVTVSIVAILSSLVNIYMMYNRKSDWYHRRIVLDETTSTTILRIQNGPLTVGSIMSYFMILWNSIGTCVLTFSGPFLFVSNGWVAAWAMVGFSFLTLNTTTDDENKNQNNSSSNNNNDNSNKNKIETLQHQDYLKLELYFSIWKGASVIQILALVVHEWNHGLWTDPTIWLSQIICITTILMILLWKKKNNNTSSSSSSSSWTVFWIILSILWLISACLVTTREGGPFSHDGMIGNGWFSAWIGWICSIIILIFGWKGCNTSRTTTTTTSRTTSTIIPSLRQTVHPPCQKNRTTIPSTGTNKTVNSSSVPIQEDDDYEDVEF